MGNLSGTGTTGLLLAAGAGSRLGLGPKALLPYRGRPLVEAIADALLAGGCREVVVVLGAGASDVSASADLGRCRTVVNRDWPSGMGGSFRLGAATADPGDHLLVALVGQPGLTADTVGRLLAAHRPGRITAAAYAGDATADAGADAGAGAEADRRRLRRGHPLLIDATLRAAVDSTVKGDAGARLFLQAHPELVDEVDCSDQSSGEDIDTPEQLYLLLRQRP